MNKSNESQEPNTKEIIIGSLFFTAIAAYFGGTGWAVGILIFCIIGAIGIFFESKKESSSTKNRDSNTGINTYYSNESAPFTPKSKSRSSNNRIIDQIQFDYIPAHGQKGTYTVKVAKGLRGNIEGYCDERDDLRTFRIDRIVKSEITRTATGEVMSVKEWRALFRGNGNQAAGRDIQK